jgi:hypothetical protein
MGKRFSEFRMLPFGEPKFQCLTWDLLEATQSRGE